MKSKTEEMKKRKTMPARGVRFTNEQWEHLKRMAGRNSTPSDYNRFLVQKDLNKVKKQNGSAAPQAAGSNAKVKPARA